MGSAAVAGAFLPSCTFLLCPPLLLPLLLRCCVGADVDVDADADAGCSCSPPAAFAAGAGLLVLLSGGHDALLEDCRR